MKHNWEYKKLGDVCSIKTGKLDANAKTSDGEYPFFTCDEKPYRIDTYAFDEEAILISGNGSNVGHVHYYNGKFNAYQRTYVLSNIKCFNPQFLVTYLKGYLRPYIYNKKKGGCIPFITLPMLLNFPIPYPFLNEQETIVAELDKINETIEDCRELLRNLDALAHSLFYDYFGDPINNIRNWSTKPLAEIAPQFPYKGNFGLSNNEVWLLNLEMIEKNTGRIILHQKIQYEDMGTSVYRICPNQVLYSKLRPNLNKVVIADDYGYCSSELLPLNPIKNILNCQYLAHLLRTNECVNLFSGKVAGAKMPRTDLKVFRKFPIPIPPLALQEKFAARIEQIEEQKKSVEQTIAELQTLLDSRMDYWFN